VREAGRKEKKAYEGEGRHTSQLANLSHW